MRPKHADVPVPKNMRDLPMTEKGYLKPWFVEGDDFRVVDEEKAADSLANRTCWICGKPNKDRAAFVTGWRSALNRIASEPPCHKECAEYAVQVCPYILLPKAQRREAGLTEEQLNPGTIPIIEENPEVFYITLVKRYKLVQYGGQVFVNWKKHDITSQVAYYKGLSIPRLIASELIKKQMERENHEGG